jgi:hypothetical protein
MALNSCRSSATRISITSHFGAIASPADAGSTEARGRPITIIAKGKTNEKQEPGDV